MTRYLLLPVLVLVAPAFAADDEKLLEAELKGLAGKWEVVAAEQDGAPLDRIHGGIMVIKDRTFDIKTKAGTELSGDIKIDPAKKPKHFDYIHQKGPLAEKTWEGIYELTGDTLKICYSEADSDKGRPTEFKAENESKRLLLTLERKK